MQLDASMVATSAHLVLTSYVAWRLLRGARSPARKTLARALVLAALYAAAYFAVRAGAGTRVAFGANLLCLTFAVFSTAEMLALARWLRRGIPIGNVALPTAVALPVGLGTAVLVLHGMWSLSTLRPLRPHFIALLVINGALFTAMIVELVRARRRRARGAGLLLFACVWPLVATVVNIGTQAGLPISSAGYHLFRDVAISIYIFGLGIAYVHEGDQPLSLRDGMVVGTLTAVTLIVTASTHLLEPLVMAAARGEAASAAQHALGLRMMLLLGAASALVIILVPRLFRAAALEPLERLTAGLAKVERGEAVSLPVERENEIGKVTRSFNGMIAALAEGRSRLEEQVRLLEDKHTEVQALNVELRQQVAYRSRELAEALAAVDEGPSSIAVGAMVGDRYRIEARLGAGGMGVVYAVVRVSDGRQLALKVMSSGTSREQGVRLAREAEIGAGLDHPNLVGVIDVGMYQGAAYLVMERVAGGSLDDARDRFGDLGFAVPVLEQIASGLATLHAGGILHRDLKPANVLLAGTAAAPVAKITDFGISRRDDVLALAATADVSAPTALAPSQSGGGKASGSQPGRTATGAILGTLSYLAPELSAGSKAWSSAADVFAFGIVAHEVLGVGHPFPAPPILDALARRPLPAPPPLGMVSPALAELLAAALDVDPERRPTAVRLQAALGAARARPVRVGPPAT